MTNMENKKLTAIDWLFEEWPILKAQIPPHIIEQAKEMDWEQKLDAFCEGRLFEIASSRKLKAIDFQEYYDKTYLEEPESDEDRPSTSIQ